MEYFWWAGERLVGTIERPLAFDTETEAIRPYRPPLDGENPLELPPDPLCVPRPAIGIAYDGERLVVIHPERFRDFVAVHRTQRWVGHNFAFDFWVVHRHADRSTRELLWQIGDRDGFSDTMILDMLLQLADGRYRKGGNRAGDDQKIYPSDLGTIAAELDCGELDKESPYRLRFGEWVGLSQAEIDGHPERDAFLSYALADVVATWRVYPLQRERAVGIMRRAGWRDDPKQRLYEIRPDALRRFGPLSEFLQVKASIVLAELSRTPLRIDRQKRAVAEAATRERYRRAIDVLKGAAPDLIKMTKPRFRTVTETVDGVKTKRKEMVRPPQPILTQRTQLPSMSNLVLAEHLKRIAAELNIDPPVSGGKKKGMSLSAKAWAHLADRSEFVRNWVDIAREAKLLAFLTAVDADAVYSNYSLLKRTGRTSAGAHRRGGKLLVPSVNVQQMPREDDKHPERSVRSLFLPPPGHKWFSCDYGYVELRSLAAVLRARFGWSKLGDAVDEHTQRGGIDPHERTALQIMGLNETAYKSLDTDTRKGYRQKAKACFHEDTEVLTDRGWVNIKEVTTETMVAQFWPGTGQLDWVRPTGTIVVPDQPLVHVRNESVDIRATPDHRMVGAGSSGLPRVRFPEQMNQFRNVWNAGIISGGRAVGGVVDEDLIRKIVCIQADGSMQFNMVRFGFTKRRKIDRFRQLFPGVESTTYTPDGGKEVTQFRIPWTKGYESLLTRDKEFVAHNLLGMPLKWRQVFMEEIPLWDGHTLSTGRRASYSSINKHNIDVVQAVAAITGRKSCVGVTPAAGNKSTLYNLSIKDRDYTRGENFAIERLPGLHTVYCLSVPSGFLIVRDKDKPLCVGNCNFGYPGGLGIKTFQQYAKVSYGATFTPAEAKQAKAKWLELYPEIKLYLADRTKEAMEWQTGRKQQALGWLRQKRLSDFLKADDKGREQFGRDEADAIWDRLDALAHAKGDDAAVADCESRRVTQAVRNLISYRACTLTGRVRNNVKYTDGCNTPFQGAAADGAKLAMWTLMRRGHRLLAFVHDAFDVAVPAAGHRQRCESVRKIMCESMETVLGQGVPVAADGEAGDCWSKS